MSDFYKFIEASKKHTLSEKQMKEVFDELQRKYKEYEESQKDMHEIMYKPFTI